ATPPPEHAMSPILDQRRELVAEPGLADARRTEDGHEVGMAFRHGPFPYRPQQGHLAFAPDQRRGRRSPGALDANGFERQPHLDRLALPLRVDRREAFISDGAPGGPVGLLADDEPSYRSGRLQPGGRVHDV